MGYTNPTWSVPFATKDITFEDKIIKITITYIT